MVILLEKTANIAYIAELDELSKPSFRILLKGRRENMRTDYQYICSLHAGELRDTEYEV